MGYLIVQVDDEPGALLLCKIMLERAGNRVVDYKGGDEVIAFIKKADKNLIEESEIPDLFILDVMMPGIDGIELTQILRRSSRLRTIPILILSGRGDADSVMRGMEAGANDYLPKPISHHDLIKHVHEIIAEHQWRSAAD